MLEARDLHAWHDKSYVPQGATCNVTKGEFVSLPGRGGVRRATIVNKPARQTGKGHPFHT